MGRHAEPFPEALDRRIVGYWFSGIRNFEEIGRRLELYGNIVRHRLIVLGYYTPKDRKPARGTKRENRTDTGRARQMRALRMMA